MPSRLTNLQSKCLASIVKIVRWPQPLDKFLSTPPEPPNEDITVGSRSSIETLPIELRLMVLKAIHNLRDIRYLCYASAAYNETYEAHYSEIICCLYGINLEPSIFPEVQTFGDALNFAGYVGWDDFEECVTGIFDRYKSRRYQAKKGYETSGLAASAIIAGYILSLDRRKRMKLVKLQRALDYYISDFIRNSAANIHSVPGMSFPARSRGSSN